MEAFSWKHNHVVQERKRQEAVAAKEREERERDAREKQERDRREAEAKAAQELQAKALESDAADDDDDDAKPADIPNFERPPTRQSVGRRRGSAGEDEGGREGGLDDNGGFGAEPSNAAINVRMWPLMWTHPLIVYSRSTSAMGKSKPPSV